LGIPSIELGLLLWSTFILHFYHSFHANHATTQALRQSGFAEKYCVKKLWQSFQIVSKC